MLDVHVPRQQCSTSRTVTLCTLPALGMKMYLGLPALGTV